MAAGRRQRANILVLGTTKNRGQPAGPYAARVKIPGANSGAFEQTTSMPIPLRPRLLPGSRERQRVVRPPLAGARSYPTKPEPAPGPNAGGFALITSSVLYTATDSKRIGVSHGVLMAIAASVISIFSIHSLIDLQSHPRGGFVEMAAVPILGGLLIFGILAGGSALQTIVYATKKRPNRVSRTNRINVTANSINVTDQAELGPALTGFAAARPRTA